MIIYGNTGKHTSIIHLLKLFFDADSMMMSIAILTNTYFGICVCAVIAIYGHSDHEMDITIEFTLKNGSR